MKLRIALFALAMGTLAGLNINAQETAPETPTKTKRVRPPIKRMEHPLEITFINDSNDTVWIIDGSQIGESMRPLVSELFLKELSKRIAIQVKAGKQTRLPQAPEKENILLVYTRQKVNRNSKDEHFFRRFKIEEKEKKARQNNHHALMSFSSVELLARGKKNNIQGTQFQVTDYTMRSPLLGCLENQE